VLQAFVSQRRHSERYREIVRTLMRHGLGGFVGPVDLGRRMRRYVPGLQGSPDPGRDAARQSRPVHLRLALEELGPAFVKLGQILSMRADLLPSAYIAELELLQDRVPAEHFDIIRATIESELGKPIDQLFARVDSVPLASASIGQVHAAELLDGTPIVLKVQRHGVAQRINQDLDILEELARIGEARSSFLRQADISGLVKEFSWTIRSELDYRREASNAERFRSVLARDGELVVPKTFQEFTTRKVLTMEQVMGVRIDRFAPSQPPAVSRPDLARRLVRSTADQILRIGVFHADPHLGNFLVGDAGELIILDFGMVGTVDERLRERLMLLALAVAGRDATRIVDEISLLGALPAGWDRHIMERDVSLLVSQYVGASLRDLPVSQILGDVMSLIRRNGIHLPSELALLAKTATMLEALSRRLDPDINVIEVVDPVIRAAMKELYSPVFWARRFKLQPLDAMFLASSMPAHIQRLARIDRNDLTFHIHYDELPETLRSLNGMVNRLAFSIMTAAAWLGTLFLFLAVDPDVTGFPGSLFLLVFAGLVGMVVYGMFAIWRSGR
jgi:ubiquinone biosynthesis protein